MALLASNILLVYACIYGHRLIEDNAAEGAIQPVTCSMGGGVERTYE